MLIPKRFSIRHQILSILCEKLNDVEKVKGKVFKQSLIDVECSTIAERLGISIKRIHELSSKMQKENEVEFEFLGNVEIIRIRENGIIAFIDRKYLINGRDFVLDSLKKYLAIISGILLLIIAVITFILNIIDTRQNKNDIQKLEKRIQFLESKKN
jgi:hypothetical protein